ncbi:Peptidase C19, ubiquitin carboxyl-terminal hydrolase 2 [Cynara cardunculus var. scolymus]|uniref:Ubiquitin carboxyl-terminal hydrolase n=1 Tax=Cynara cardunculus var. scolymus TaxID=59895 RepID=A0A118JVG2_CYNCS|nr:Peptidase C19, ubiquitin carboxyl-terminal hydrolase 2 [Cynara cardunculus var. scolymus]
MAETLSLIDNNIIVTQKPIDRGNPGGESTESLAPPDKSPFRRIEFHQARKPFTGFTNGGGDGSFRLETLNPATTSSKNTHGNQQSVGLDTVGGGSLGKKRDASEFENGLDPELSFGITFRRIGAGLENLGNTCFLNSVLQCLTYTEPLAAYLQSGKHQVTCRKAGFCALCAIQKHVSRALQSSGRSLAPKDLVSNLRISRTFRNSRQEDAHEYMVNLLESMHKCCLPTGVPSESQSAYDRSLVHKIFGGRLRSQVKCMQCNYCSNKFDPFLDLSLEILKADTLYKAFANFTAKEQLDGGAKQYQCQQCKQKVKALKQLTIHKAPNVLTVHLKRFGSHMSGQKIDKKIQFGSTLDLKPFVTGLYVSQENLFSALVTQIPHEIGFYNVHIECLLLRNLCGDCIPSFFMVLLYLRSVYKTMQDGDLKYTLYGVLVHAGWSTHSGHYYCFVRTSSGMWYSLDDNRVIQVSEKKVFEQKAYMLFYFRDRKSFPSKKPADVVHQKEKIVMNGTLNGSSARKETQMNAGLSNRSLNAHKSLATVGAERNGFGPNVPKETQMNNVPRWDEDESTPYQIRETTRVRTIGYVGDEWDEEYDRGKRKKLRISKTEFDGKNPFQDIANERLKGVHAEKQQLSKRPSKSKAFNESRSGNRPIRI